MKRFVIVGAAPEAFWDGRWTPDRVICADGGADNAMLLGLVPDIIVGDNDSAVGGHTGTSGMYGGGREARSPLYVSLPAEKDATDMEACLDLALREGASEIALLGATGGRLDHFMGNVGLLERAHGKAFLLDKNHEIRLLTDTLTVGPPHRYRYISVVPLDEAARGVTITGGKYPLANATLSRCATAGISNEPLPGQFFSVWVNSGKALLILSEKTR